MPSSATGFCFARATHSCGSDGNSTCQPGPAACGSRCPSPKASLEPSALLSFPKAGKKRSRSETSSGYVPASPEAAENTLTVRDGLQGTVSTIPRQKWRVSEYHRHARGRFRTGQGLARFHTAPRIRRCPDSASLPFATPHPGFATRLTRPHRPKYAYAFGSSQSGRFLRDFLYQGFNTDEGNRQVFDAVMANIAGALENRLEQSMGDTDRPRLQHRHLVSLCRHEAARSRDRRGRRRARQPRVPAIISPRSSIRTLESVLAAAGARRHSFTRHQTARAIWWCPITSESTS